MAHLYHQIAESLRRRIAGGELEIGQRLPPVRQLAHEWGCTPGTVSRAYRQLADEGLVEGQRGGGTRVRDGASASGLPDLHWAHLVNRAERYLLAALGSGHTAAQAQAALALAVSRWRDLGVEEASVATVAAQDGLLRFAGSHDLAVDLLAQAVAARPNGGRIDLSFIGSLGGLVALSRGEADIAGIHLWDAATDTYNRPFVERVLPGVKLALVTLVQRALGFIVPPGNPQELAGPADLVRDGVVWVNRQPGSGTRVWLDEQLRRAGIETSAVRGYGRSLLTHLAVAEAVHAGEATAGLGILAAARATGLDFVPLADELYQLVVPERVWGDALWQETLAALRRPAFAAAVAELGGYGTGATGEVVWL